MMMPPRVTEALRWARRNGWRPVERRQRRDSGDRWRVWTDPDQRITVYLDVTGYLMVYQYRAQVGVPVQILDVQVGCWQHILDALTVHRILPRRFNTAVKEQLDAAMTLARRLNGPMVARLRACAADTSTNWNGKVTVYPPEARGLVDLIDSLLRGAVET